MCGFANSPDGIGIIVRGGSGYRSCFLFGWSLLVHDHVQLELLSVFERVVFYLAVAVLIALKDVICGTAIQPDSALGLSVLPQSTITPVKCSEFRFLADYAELCMYCLYGEAWFAIVVAALTLLMNTDKN